MKILLNPCPFCGSTDIRFAANYSYGHGDMGYTDARFICESCIATKGQSDYGITNPDTMIRAAEAWNIRQREEELITPEHELRVVSVPDREPTEDEKMTAKLIEKYSNVSILELLKMFKPTN